jgi:hypothetical protein
VRRYGRIDVWVNDAMDDPRTPGRSAKAAPDADRPNRLRLPLIRPDRRFPATQSASLTTPPNLNDGSSRYDAIRLQT